MDTVPCDTLYNGQIRLENFHLLSISRKNKIYLRKLLQNHSEEKTALFKAYVELTTVHRRALITVQKPTKKKRSGMQPIRICYNYLYVSEFINW